ncbi:MAG: sulfurase [Gemmatimonadetes bacterium]|nr:sulfurase [Gemmatimonadota bacterium]
MSGEGRLEAIWIKPLRRGPMAPVGGAALVAAKGMVGNADQGGTRQVTVIESEVCDLIRTTLPAAEPVMRRANLMVSGIRLCDTAGHTLTVGGVRILIHGETRPCYRMDEQCHGLTAALEPDWRGGAFGIVVDSGEVRVGDAVFLDPPAER